MSSPKEDPKRKRASSSVKTGSAKGSKPNNSRHCDRCHEIRAVFYVDTDKMTDDFHRLSLKKTGDG